MENATYSILSPEGFASILYKDAKKAKEAAGIMKITAEDLYGLGAVDAVIPEGIGLQGEGLSEAASVIEQRMKRFFADKLKKTGRELAGERFERFREL